MNRAKVGLGNVRNQKAKNLKAETVNYLCELSGSRDRSKFEKLYQELLDDGIIQVLNSEPAQKTRKVRKSRRQSLLDQPRYMMRLMYVRRSKGREKYASIKLGNYLRNLPKLEKSALPVVENVVGIVYDIPILKICAILHIIQLMMENVTEPVTGEQALVMYGLWVEASHEEYMHPEIPWENGFQAVNRLMARKGRKAMTEDQYIDNLAVLEKIRSLELKGNTIILKETVSV